jgi:hypothetical protein
MNRLQEVKTFTTLNADAIAHTVDYGIAKIPNFLGQATLDLLNRRFGNEDGSNWSHEVLKGVDDFKPIYDWLYTDKSADLVVSSRYLFANLERRDEPSHTDSVAPHGISILMPFYGPKALFAASNSSFGLGWGTFAENTSDYYSPQWLTTYGPTDAIAIRQTIDSFNGQPKSLNQMHHAGGADGLRKLFMVDLIKTDLIVEMPQAA